MKMILSKYLPHPGYQMKIYGPPKLRWDPLRLSNQGKDWVIYVVLVIAITTHHIFHIPVNAFPKFIRHLVNSIQQPLHNIAIATVLGTQTIRVVTGQVLNHFAIQWVNQVFYGICEVSIFRTFAVRKTTPLPTLLLGSQSAAFRFLPQMGLMRVMVPLAGVKSTVFPRTIKPYCAPMNSLFRAVLLPMLLAPTPETKTRSEIQFSIKKNGFQPSKLTSPDSVAILVLDTILVGLFFLPHFIYLLLEC